MWQEFLSRSTAAFIYVQIKPLSANSTKWSNTLKQSFYKKPTNCLSVFDHFVVLGLKG